jgi:hypothetical protein
LKQTPEAEAEAEAEGMAAAELVADTAQASAGMVADTVAVGTAGLAVATAE